jgi:hypothetical protein
MYNLQTISKDLVKSVTTEHQLPRKGEINNGVPICNLQSDGRKENGNIDG